MSCLILLFFSGRGRHRVIIVPAVPAVLLVRTVGAVELAVAHHTCKNALVLRPQAPLTGVSLGTSVKNTVKK